jgi:hypothetical protein
MVNWVRLEKELESDIFLTFRLNIATFNFGIITTRRYNGQL